ncbi:MAG TPA: class I tRNA ligase family protein, partial [Edaphobacter sp.]|nr:class I tRNA ligase family protein [Edaphobacter sp.]
ALTPAEIRHLFTNLTLLLAPFAPFFAAEMWELLGGEGVVFRAAWPVADEALVREDEVEIPVQVNGKLVVVVKVAAGSHEGVVEAAALADAKVKARIEGKTVAKVIVVPGKLVNLVVR